MGIPVSMRQVMTNGLARVARLGSRSQGSLQGDVLESGSNGVPCVPFLCVCALEASSTCTDSG